MRYVEVKIYTTTEGIDPLTCILMDMGIAGFAIEDADELQDLLNKKNSFDWDYVDESLMALAYVETNITFYLEEAGEHTGLLNRLQNILEELKLKKDIDYGRLSLTAKMVDDADWKDNWKAYFKPTKITDRIVIKPTWEAYEGNKDELVIELDPGMAFGTGNHPTTTLCIKLLEKYIEPGEDSVIDVGCGSGILAMVSARLGAKNILAVDIDPIAIQVSKENIELNHLSSRILVKLGDLTKGLDERAEIVVANLMADLIMLLSKDVAEHLKGKGIYISSGILVEKREIVAAAIESCGFHVLEVVEEGEWCAIAAQSIKGRADE